MMNDLLNIIEVAAYLKVGRATIQRWSHSGKLPAVKMGRDYRIRRSDLAAWYESRRVVA